MSENPAWLEVEHFFAPFLSNKMTYEMIYRYHVFGSLGISRPLDTHFYTDTPTSTYSMIQFDVSMVYPPWAGP